MTGKAPEPANNIGEISSILAGLYGRPQWRSHAPPLDELVATILSQHTSDVNSERAFAALRFRFPTWEDVAAAETIEVARAIQPGGLASINAPRIQEVLRAIEAASGEFSLDWLNTWPLAAARDWLQALPGVGPKTAACVLLFSLGQPAMPVDTHVHRVGRRLGLIPPDLGPGEAHTWLDLLIGPDRDAIYALHLNFIRHGRTICKARSPACTSCALSGRCPSAFRARGSVQVRGIGSFLAQFQWPWQDGQPTYPRTPMQLTVLGGSAAGPNPGQGCSGYLLQSGPTRLVLDLGPGTLPELRRHTDFRSIDGVVLSHLHLDHWLDVLALRFALAYNPIPAPRPIALWMPPGGIGLLDRLALAIAGQTHTDDYFSVFEARDYNPDCALCIGEISLRFTPTVHYVPCWAIRASNGQDGDLFYTADTGPAADLVPFGSGSRIVVAEGTAQRTSSEPIATRGHLTPAEAGTLARAVGARTLVLSHLWAENNPFAAITAARRQFRGRVELAAPGLTIAWTESRD